MNTQEMIKKIENIVESACKKETNIFGYGIWSNHIVFVVKYAKLLAEKLHADKEIVEIASLLHDYAGISNKEDVKEHHIHGARLADELLTSYGYDKDKIEKVKQCIFSHRGSVVVEKNTLEEQCVASADGMAHIDKPLSLLLFKCKRDGSSLDEGCVWVKNKLDRSWNKLCPQAKEIIKEKYIATKQLLELFA